MFTVLQQKSMRLKKKHVPKAAMGCVTGDRTSRRKARVRKDMDIEVGRQPVRLAMFSTLAVHSRAQVANTRPVGQIWPSSLFYPAPCFYLAAAPSYHLTVKE